MGRYSSGQRGQTVNLMAHAFEGSNPSLPTIFINPYDETGSYEKAQNLYDDFCEGVSDVYFEG